MAPFGQGDKRSSAVLLALEVEWLPRRASALHLTAYRLAEPVNITLKEYQGKGGYGSHVDIAIYKARLLMYISNLI